jgi:hypothetical protein
MDVDCIRKGGEYSRGVDEFYLAGPNEEDTEKTRRRHGEDTEKTRTCCIARIMDLLYDVSL